MNAIKAIFWNPGQRRLRSGWRLLIQFVLFFVLVIGTAIVAYVLGNGPGAVAAGSAAYLAGGLGLAWLLARFLDRRPVADYGFHLTPGWWLDLGFGLVLGAALMTGVFLSESLAGWVRVTAPAVTASGLGPVPALLLSVFFYLAVAFNEEFTFRGYQLRNLAEGLAVRRLGPGGAIVGAWVMSSAAFGLAHLTNGNGTGLSTANLVLAGLLLSLPYLLTGELAIPIGLHLTWNLFQGTVYGFPVSGSAPSRALLVPEQSGPALWTGGDFGPEGGLLGTLWTLAGCVLVVVWLLVRRGRLGLYVPLARYEAPARKGNGESVLDVLPAE
jgi:membrane protease YdiL (CAAX protease family)